MSDDRLERIETKIDKSNEHLSRIDVTLAALTETVKTHEQRSTNLESIVLPMKAKEDELKGVVKFIKLVAVIIGILTGIAEILHWMIK